MWLYLSKKHWMTDRKVLTGADGRATIRAFKGDYRIGVTSGARKKFCRVKVEKDKGFRIVL